MTDTQQRSPDADERSEQPQRLEREVIRDLEVSEELAGGVKGGRPPTGEPTTADTTVSA